MLRKPCINSTTCYSSLLLWVRVFTVCAVAPSSTFCDPYPFRSSAEDGLLLHNNVLNWTESPSSVLNILRDRALYNKHSPPGHLFNKSTTVSIGFYIESMSSFRAQTMDFEIDIYFAIVWTDPRLRHTKSLPILVNDLRIASFLWQPDLYFVNSKDASLQDVTSPNFMILVYPDGVVFKSIRVSLTLSCMMNFERFPLDVQACPIIIQSYAYVEALVNVSWFVDEKKGFPISYNKNIRLNDMEILGRTYNTCSYWYEMLRGRGYWSCLRGEIRMKRQVFFHVIQTYLPTAMLVCISWLSFWLDPRASPARIGLTITTLLTLTTMSNGARLGLPQVSYIKAIDIWLSACTGFVFCVLLEYTLINHFLNRRIKKGHVHFTPVNEKNHNSALLYGSGMDYCVRCNEEAENKALQVDRMSRVIFPASFGTFAVSYWLLYLLTHDTEQRYHFLFINLLGHTPNLGKTFGKPAVGMMTYLHHVTYLNGRSYKVRPANYCDMGD